MGQALLPGLQRKDDAYLEMEALLKNANVEKLCLNSGALAAQGRLFHAVSVAACGRTDG